MVVLGNAALFECSVSIRRSLSLIGCSIWVYLVVQLHTYYRLHMKFLVKLAKQNKCVGKKLSIRIFFIFEERYNITIYRYFSNRQSLLSSAMARKCINMFAIILKVRQICVINKLLKVRCFQSKRTLMATVSAANYIMTEYRAFMTSCLNW